MLPFPPEKIDLFNTSEVRSVRSSIEIAAPAKKVFHAFLKQDMLSAWWKVERSLIEEKEGGLYTVAWNISETGFEYLTTGIIQIYKPDSELLIDKLCYFNPLKPIFGPMSLHIVIEEKGSISILHLTQDGYQSGADWDWYYNAVHDAWPQVLITLKSYLEQK